MKLEESVSIVSSKFIYTPDPNSTFDVWRVMNLEHGIFQGDCEDYAITVIWYACDQSLLKFIWKTVFTREYKLHRVMDYRGGWHVVGSNEDLWFDNWTLKALPIDEFFKVTRHEYKMTYFLPFMIFSFITGWLKK